MHLRKRGCKSWTAILDLGRGDDGKRRHKNITVRGTKRDAEKAAIAWLATHSFLAEALSPPLVTLLKDLERRVRKLEEQKGSSRNSARVFSDLEWEALVLLGRLGLQPRRQQIAGKKVDFILEFEKLVIEVDGIFHDLPDQQKADRESDSRLKEAGYHVLHLRHDERHKWEQAIVRALGDKEIRRGDVSMQPVRSDELTTEEAIKRLFPRRVIERVKRELGNPDDHDKDGRSTSRIHRKP